MALFVLRYLSCLLIFVLGLKAPGIISHIPEDEDNLLGRENVSQVDTYLLAQITQYLTPFSPRPNPRSRMPGRS